MNLYKFINRYIIFKILTLINHRTSYTYKGCQACVIIHARASVGKHVIISDLVGDPFIRQWWKSVFLIKFQHNVKRIYDDTSSFSYKRTHRDLSTRKTSRRRKFMYIQTTNICVYITLSIPRRHITLILCYHFENIIDVTYIYMYIYVLQSSALRFINRRHFISLLEFYSTSSTIMYIHYVVFLRIR